MATSKQPRSFDELRAAYPTYAFAVYAFDPKGRVRLEIVGDAGDGRTKTVEGATLGDAIAALFPEPAKRARKPRKPAADPAPDPVPEESFLD